MNLPIFNSLFWLNFKDRNLETSFALSKQSTILLSNKIIYPILTIISVFFLTLLIGFDLKYNIHEQKETSKSIYFLTLLSIAITFTVLGIIMIVLIFINQNHTKFQSTLPLFSYILFIIFTFYLKVLLETMIDFPDDLIYLFSVLEYFFRILWHLFSFVQFKQTLVINFILPACILIMFFLFPSIDSLITDAGISYVLLNLGIILVTYFITKTIKRKYFSQEQAKSLTLKHETILNFLNTGYMQVKLGKITCINSALYNTLNMTTVIQLNPLPKNTQGNEVSIDPGLVFDILFNGTISYYREDYVQTEDAILSNRENYGGLLLRFRGLWEDRVIEEGKEDIFIFLAHKTIELDGINSESHITYEIRFKYTFDEFEFIFNDITRTKDFEQKEYDWKMKNIFLTKIAHEFKNPLLSVNELIDQIRELVDNKRHEFEGKMSSKEETDFNTLEEKCAGVKSVADYLLLLIKDLDYFSANDSNINEIRDCISSNNANGIMTTFPNNQDAKNNPSNSPINPPINLNSNDCCNVYVEKVDLNKLALFCSGVAQSKLSELNKEDIINYSTVIQTDIPKVIYTDCIKLKQILINLISNAIKFTKKGKISLEIIKSTTYENHITFYVKDTGIGLSNKIKKNLKNSFGYKSHTVSDYAHMGIGLAIIKDLTSRIGTEIQFESEANTGSQFWFSIPLSSLSAKVTNNNISLISDTNTLAQSINKHHKNTSLSNELDIQIQSHHNDLEIISNSIEENNTSALTERRTSITLHTSTSNGMIDKRKQQKRTMKIIVADDEFLVRKAQIRMIMDEAHKKNIELNIIEANDGLEILNELYNSQCEGIDCIISDQKMKFINGAACYRILSKDTNYSMNIPFFIVTAYNSSASYFKGINCERIYTKPLRKCDIDLLLGKLLVNKVL